MVVWTMLDHFGPAHFPTVPRPLPMHAIKVGARMPYKSVKVPLFCRRAGDFYTMRPLNLWQIFEAYFLLMRGWGVVEIVFIFIPEYHLRNMCTTARRWCEVGRATSYCHHQGHATVTAPVSIPPFKPPVKRCPQEGGTGNLSNGHQVRPPLRAPYTCRHQRPSCVIRGHLTRLF